jgi:hypothetical protein
MPHTWDTSCCADALRDWCERGCPSSCIGLLSCSQRYWTGVACVNVAKKLNTEPLAFLLCYRRVCWRSCCTASCSTRQQEQQAAPGAPTMRSMMVACAAASAARRWGDQGGCSGAAATPALGAAEVHGQQIWSCTAPHVSRQHEQCCTGRLLGTPTAAAALRCYRGCFMLCHFFKEQVLLLFGLQALPFRGQTQRQAASLSDVFSHFTFQASYPARALLQQTGTKCCLKIGAAVDHPQHSQCNSLQGAPVHATSTCQGARDPAGQLGSHTKIARSTTSVAHPSDWDNH